MYVGVDEAGKGPVLGSMFVAAVRAEPDVIPAAVDDSKRLAPARREELADQLREQVDAVSVVEIPVERIDDPETDMNQLTVDGHAKALDELAQGGDHCYLDAGDTNAVRFERRVQTSIGADADVRAEHGADETYPIVGAASIIAKSARETHVDGLASEYGAVGSGYPGDETTRTFLRDYVHERGSLPACARESWQTSRDIMCERDQAALTDF
ncbi:RNase HII [Halovenus aranensis]|jgi:ribonuclease HII|uniref:Ribonuclease HII n=1 Tax=Halovenus aranensis TaxID=890420 RepID=A0A1G8T1D4_9EURY|nr:ribonuclease HII [Halovenus aranensis]SDJ35257.1 RNase HII [Halovenus aranensis]